jgi:hypothetical protein
VRRTRLAIALVLAACGSKSDPPATCHDRVTAMAAHLAAPRSLAELHAQPASPQEIAQRLVPAVGSCRAAGEVLGGIGSLQGGTDKRAYLHDKLPPAIEACQCAAEPETVGPLVEQLFDAWAAPAAP